MTAARAAGAPVRTGRGRRLAIGLLLGLGAGALGATRAGRFLVVEDAFVRAEAALVLSGNPVPRSLAARDLYRAGRVDRIIVIPEPPDPWRAELLAIGLADPDERPWPQRILLASGVPEASVSFLPAHADGAIVEAIRVREYFGGRAPRSLVLITSKSASRRARFIFRRILGRDGVTVLSWPTPYDQFDARRWWAQPRNALSVVTEYQKLLANAATLLTRRL